MFPGGWLRAFVAAIHAVNTSSKVGVNDGDRGNCQEVRYVSDKTQLTKAIQPTVIPILLTLGIINTCGSLV